MAFASTVQAINLVLDLILVVILVFTVLSLQKQNAQVVKSRFFLRYSQLKYAFYVGMFGSIFLAVGVLLNVLLDIKIAQDAGEILFHIALIVFSFLLYGIIKVKSKSKNGIRKI